jgi:hypothetical protein
MGFQSTKVIARSFGFGAATRTASAFTPSLPTPVTSNSWTRKAPPVRAADAILWPFRNASKRKFTPSKHSQSVRPAASFGRVNSARYHQGAANGLSLGMSSFEKFALGLYDMPGNLRRFMP